MFPIRAIKRGLKNWFMQIAQAIVGGLKNWFVQIAQAIGGGSKNWFVQIAQAIEGGNYRKVIRYDHRYECNIDLPGDLMVEIVQRLPVKSLLRFELVSKEWKFLIRSPEFIDKHLIYQKHKKTINYLNSHNGITLISKRDQDDYGATITKRVLQPRLPIDIRFDGISVVGSSNGLVCVEFYRSKFEHRNRSFFIWNPATQQLKVLPLPQLDPIIHNASTVIAAFSYIPSTADYKLVRVLVIREGEKYKQSYDDLKFFARVEVLDLGTNCWREVLCHGAQDEKFHELPGDICRSPVVVNGCLYWLGTFPHRLGTFPVHEHSSMVSFDLEKEIFRPFALPYPFGEGIDSTFTTPEVGLLAVFDENLAIFVYPNSMPRGYREDGRDGRDRFERYYEVWIYEESNHSCRKQFAFGPLGRRDHPMGFWGNREIIIYSQSSDSYLYNLYNNEIKNHLCCRDGQCTFVHPYVESLVRV